MSAQRQSVITDLKKVTEALEGQPSPSSGINRLLNEWDALKDLVVSLRDEIRDLKTLLTEEKKKKMSTPSAEGNGWVEYRKLVMKELETHGNCLDTIQRDVTEIKTDLALLKQQMHRKATLASLASGGGVSVLGGIILWVLQNWK